ncbi:MAG: helix-turn-helix domain-containing protein [Muribaculaceae bacterium]|nr:helix-turn-helix domain-containing protein [Muribaculaceae bacterium]
MPDYYEYSIPELVQLLGSRFRDYRLRTAMTQKDVAEQTGLTINTIHKFENGKAPNLSLGTFLLLMKAIGCINGIDQLLPELPPSAFLVKDDGKKIQRIRHTSPNTKSP